MTICRVSFPQGLKYIQNSFRLISIFLGQSFSVFYTVRNQYYILEIVNQGSNHPPFGAIQNFENTSVHTFGQ